MCSCPHRSSSGHVLVPDFTSLHQKYIRPTTCRLIPRGSNHVRLANIVASSPKKAPFLSCVKTTLPMKQVHQELRFMQQADITHIHSKLHMIISHLVISQQLAGIADTTLNDEKHVTNLPRVALRNMARTAYAKSLPASPSWMMYLPAGKLHGLMKTSCEASVHTGNQKNRSLTSACQRA